MLAPSGSSVPASYSLCHGPREPLGKAKRPPPSLQLPCSLHGHVASAGRTLRHSSTISNTSPSRHQQAAPGATQLSVGPWLLPAREQNWWRLALSSRQPLPASAPLAVTGDICPASLYAPHKGLVSLWP